jgi:hypothetical protein
MLKRCNQMIGTLSDFLADLEHHRENMRDAYKKYEEDP